MKANDLFPMNGIDLTKDFLLLESYDLVEQDRSHSSDQMTKPLALLEPSLYGCWFFGCWVYAWKLNCLVVVADSMPGELGLYHGLEHYCLDKVESLKKPLSSLVYHQNCRN
jgi:hypothetical protein